MVYDMKDKTSFDDISTWYQEIANNVDMAKVCVTLLGVGDHACVTGNPHVSLSEAQSLVDALGGKCSFFQIPLDDQKVAERALVDAARTVIAIRAQKPLPARHRPEGTSVWCDCKPCNNLLVDDATPRSGGGVMRSVHDLQVVELEPDTPQKKGCA